MIPKPFSRNTTASSTRALISNHRIERCITSSWSPNLELVSSPECPIIQIAAWLALLDKLARIKNSIVGLKPQVAIHLPAHFRARTVPDEARVALSCGDNQKSGNGIHSVSHAFPPLKYPIDGRSHAVRQCRFRPRVYIDKVDGTWASGGDDAKIIALWK